MPTLENLVQESLQKINSDKKQTSFKFENVKFTFKKGVGFYGFEILSDDYNFCTYDILSIETSEIVDEIKNRLEDIISENNSQIDSKIIESRLRNKELVEFNENQMRDFLVKLLPGYVGLKTEAKSGSEYISINNKNVRFSDHVRPINSKWDKIHVGECFDAPKGLVTKEEMLNFLLVLKIENYNNELLDTTFA